MAARSQYDSPDQQLVALAIIARRRGIEFDIFWRHCVRQGKANILTSTGEDVAQERIGKSWTELRQGGDPLDVVRWPSDSGDRLEWQPAIYETRDSWERSFECKPPLPRERAVALLGDVFAELRRRGAADERAEGFDLTPAVA